MLQRFLFANNICQLNWSFFDCFNSMLTAPQFLLAAVLSPDKKNYFKLSDISYIG